MAAGVVIVGVAAAVAVEAGQRIEGAGHERGAEHVARAFAHRAVGAWPLLMIAIAVAISPDTSLMLPGTIMVLFFCASWL